MHPASHRVLGALCVVAGSLVTPSLIAQRTLTYTEPDLHYRNGVELFERSNYAAARSEFERYLNQRRPLLNTSGTPAAGSPSADPNAVSAEYYMALSSLYADQPGAEALVDRFVRNHSENPKAGQLYGDLGLYYMSRQDFTSAITYLQKAVNQTNTAAKQRDYQFNLALAYYNTQDLARALPLLNAVKADPDYANAAAASYYAGVINFRNGQYNEAVSDFRRIENNPTYQSDVPNWLAQAYYKQGRYDELTAYTEPLLKRNTGPALAEVALFTAEVYYRQGQYAQAIPAYKRYLAAKGATAPAAVKYRYGQSLYKTGNYTDAITQLKPVAAGKDTTAQYAAYTLGISYLQTDNPSYALTAFDQSGRLAFNPSIQEESRFTHAKLQLDQKRGSEAISELNDFIKKYPDSRFENEANELVGEAYLASNNYPAAIAYIEKLKNRTARINATYQRLTFNQAVADYNAERYPAALINFNKSLTVSGDPELKSGATFWKAEALSAQKKWAEAIPLYSQVRSGEYGQKSLYGLGYAFYNQKDYTKALGYFREYIKAAAGSTDPTVGDAYIRSADCLLATKQYNEAMKAYDQAIATGRADSDYATYQKGVILTYVGRDAEAKALFDQVQRNPSSRYADDALFQTANVDFEKGSFAAAVAGYSKLITSRPNSYLLPAALLKRAVAYANQQQYDPAVADYKRILDDYGTSPQAQSALLGLQNTLDDANRTDEFSDVLGKYKRSNPGSTDVEKAEFENAKSLYFAEKYPQALKAFQTFSQEYPNSPSRNEARYYGADSYAKTGDVPAALRLYGQLIQEGKSTFAVKAASRAAELERRQKNFPGAIKNYQYVLSRSNERTDQVTAQLGMMDTYYSYKVDSAAVIARQIVTAGNVVPGAQNRAQLMLGKVALSKADYKTATTEFEKTIALAKDVSGAEANYLIGDALYKQKKYKESIATLLRFNEQFDGFEFWKGKAFILVADNNVALGETAQAKAVLTSIIENAAEAEIVAEAKTKLAAIETK
ncbi:tetratricopeptide repeat protein [Fibrivirga algicola]|uniref:Tetratricopeptide repeat protein n=1 Tax=Fibrivirga algicola TaxID=2950420 RepID=A0ABX0QN58_9BACT|nr:tetratricopeptide repeat protein [Fibrivirga algicola]NID12442.1 tetratricopeptide repeat protein [Fibrivirga algicola]